MGGRVRNYGPLTAPSVADRLRIAASWWATVEQISAHTSCVPNGHTFEFTSREGRRFHVTVEEDLTAAP